jgi:hypothetical protein
MQMIVLDIERPDRSTFDLDPYAAGAERALGWQRKPEGLCRADVCIPVPEGSLDLAAVASALRRPLVIDESAGVAAVGASWADRAATLNSGIAPDFSLPDLAGKEWTLSQFRGRKVVLYAYASW